MILKITMTKQERILVVISIQEIYTMSEDQTTAKSSIWIRIHQWEQIVNI